LFVRLLDFAEKESFIFIDYVYIYAFCIEKTNPIPKEFDESLN